MPARSERESLLDDLESGTGRIPSTDGRIGAWYAFNSGEAETAQVPAPTTPGVPITPEQVPDELPQDSPCNDTLAMHTTGSGYDWAGIGFDLKFDGTTYGTYDASRFDGITYLAAGLTDEFTVRISTIATTSTQYGGTCTLDEVNSTSWNDGCQPYYGPALLDEDLSPHWVPFRELEIRQGEWETIPDFDPSGVTNVQFYTKGTFDFWVDNVAFYAGKPGCCAISPPECGGIIDIPNATLRSALGQGSLSCSDVCYRESVYSSVAWNSPAPSEPQSLSGLQCLVGLRHLSVVGEAVDDIDAIAGLIHLTQLILSKNQVADLRPLASLENLKILDLAENSITDLQPLAGLTRLTQVTLNGNSIASIEPLKELTKMSSLVLTSNQVVDVTALSSMTALQTLNLADNAVVETGPLAGLRQLTTLDLSNNRVRDIAPLSQLVGLSVLKLQQNQIKSLTGFGGLPNLPELDLSENQISSLAGFGHMDSLKKLKLAKNELDSIDGLEALPKLVELDLSDNQLPAVTDIAAISSLTKLTLSNNRISNLANLTELTQLGSLNVLGLAGNPLGTLENLPVFDHLTWIDLSNTGIGSVFRLSAMPNLTDIYLSDNQISNLGILEDFTQLKYLDVANNQISDLSEFVTAPWAPAIYYNRYTWYPTLNLRNNPIDCDAQALNLAMLRAMDLRMDTDCPEP